jgi:trans-aconitate methyltransferase
MSLRETIVEQFRRPSGPLGSLAGAIMATRPSNRLRNSWTVALLAIEPADRVLEVGCGPGLALRACSARATEGDVTGLDHSTIMLRQAMRRNAGDVARGHVHLRLGDIDTFKQVAPQFDKAFSVNVIQFVPDKAAFFVALHSVVKPGATVATTYQPRHRNPTRADAIDMAKTIAAAMGLAGFVDITTEELPLRRVPAVCVLGRTPQDTSQASLNPYGRK